MSRADEAIYVFALMPRDAELTCGHLREVDIDARAVSTFDELVAIAGRDAGALLLTDDAVPTGGWSQLASALAKQPAWSDIPLIVCSRKRQLATDHVLASITANVTVIETPVRVSTIVSAAKAALRARRRQYEVRDLLAQREESERRKDEFLAMLGHELRNPVAAMSLALQLKHMTTPIHHDREIQVVERQLKTLSRLVDDLLDVSRVTLGKIRLELADVDLGDAARRCVQALAADADMSGIRLHIDTPSQPAFVRGDLVRVEQILANLVTNAIKYTPRGGHVDVAVQSDGDTILLVVRDSGIGIDPDIIPRVFELFAQAKQGLDRSRGGLGLGLALVKRLVELHGGAIDAQSEGAGRGSTFTVTFPALRSVRVVETTQETHLVAVPDQALRVLVVEDNEDARVMLHQLLESHGHAVDDAADGMDGLDKLLASPPDAAVIDIGLPRIDGYQLARRVRKALDPAPVMIAITGYGQPADRERAIEAGFDVFLVKPVDIHELARALARCKRRVAANA